MKALFLSIKIVSMCKLRASQRKFSPISMNSLHGWLYITETLRSILLCSETENSILVFRSYVLCNDTLCQYLHKEPKNIVQCNRIPTSPNTI